MQEIKVIMQPEEIEALVRDVSEKLGETAEEPLKQIALLAQHLGESFVRECLDETMKIEEAGGMKTHNSERRRTPGGVFFFIVKGKMEAELRQEIFPNFGQTKKSLSIPWEDRAEYTDLVSAEPGTMRNVRLIVQGRPGKVQIQDDTVMTTITHVHGNAPYPRGVPYPPEDATIYHLYMGLKHWERIAPALEANPKDHLIAEGTMILDESLGSIAVFVTALSTREMDKKARRHESRKADNSKAKPAKEAAARSEEKPKARPVAEKGKAQAADNNNKKKAAPPAGRTPDRSRSAYTSAGAAPLPIPDLPETAPPDVQDKLRQLHNAAETLRSRIAAMEAKGQRTGLDMTRKLLKNTEKQIETLETQYSEQLSE